MCPVLMDDLEPSYSSFSDLAVENVKFHCTEDYASSLEVNAADLKCFSGGPSYQLSLESVEEHNGDNEHSSSAQRSNTVPEVNFRNVLSGLFSILTRQIKSPALTNYSQDPDRNISFLESGKNEDNFLHASVYMPSAPPLDPAVAFEMADHRGSYKEILESEPPDWLPDSSTNVCMGCSSRFTPIALGRHHCRLCGGIFCRKCTRGRCLLPVKFREREPQRVCDICYDKLDPVQSILINFNSNAVRLATHDVIDWTCMRGWLNMPFALSLEHEIYKATVTLRCYNQVARLNSERSIPTAILKGANGLAILTVAKVGVLLAYKFGTGLVVARKSDGSWSAPSAIVSLGLGWGPQAGGELTDFIIVLHGSGAVKTFCSRVHFSLGAALSAAAGPVGRVLEADLRAGERGSGICYTYSCSKGAFVGASLEGNLVATRMDTNLRFYGDPYLTTSDILLGTVCRPLAAEPLYYALDDIFPGVKD